MVRTAWCHISRRCRGDREVGGVEVEVGVGVLSVENAGTR